ncbi:hypothetical protein SPRG_01713 [Saprolegnia parasitica CBS 223.65]|uniref:Uncharacterized protein n=1 Tax=Saprolegnia parasitica (strain CBS 223.65) TaxID=695850 RepID=A0A067CT12_SAPPC|nr:hypothetical protein SPRG_01713 [Saprolegnia parasitica CBS 223.65]KDO33834.1 hypothetical protein SPRG_01713 [Saprolegnia parasitica CBS 223.65]|eukprot:XP_012195470.1 hypothetical protein SPRG_01713 [Saprolegnia parasitica CBS 223.65]
MCQQQTPEWTVREFPPIVGLELLDGIERRRFVLSFLWCVIVVAPVVAAGQSYVDLPTASAPWRSPIVWGAACVLAVFLKFSIRYCSTWPTARRVGAYYWQQMYGTDVRHTTLGHFVRLAEYHMEKFGPHASLEEIQVHYWTRWSIWSVVVLTFLATMVWYNQIVLPVPTIYLAGVVAVTAVTVALQYLYVQLPLYAALQLCPELGMTAMSDERIPFAMPI